MCVPCLSCFYKLSRFITSKYTSICVTCCMTFLIFLILQFLYFGLCPTLYILGCALPCIFWAAPYLVYFGLCPTLYILGCALPCIFWAVPYLVYCGLCPISYGWALPYLVWVGFALSRMGGLCPISYNAVYILIVPHFTMKLHPDVVVFYTRGS